MSSVCSNVSNICNCCVFSSFMWKNDNTLSRETFTSSSGFFLAYQNVNNMKAHWLVRFLVNIYIVKINRRSIFCWLLQIFVGTYHKNRSMKDLIKIELCKNKQNVKEMNDILTYFWQIWKRRVRLCRDENYIKFNTDYKSHNFVNLFSFHFFP